MNVLFNFKLGLIFTVLILSSCLADNKKKSPSQNQQTEIDKLLTVNKTGWEKGMVTDENGNNAKMGILKTISGKMSNVAVHEAPLKVNLQITKDKISYINFQLMSRIEGPLPQNEHFNIKITKDNGESEFIKQYSSNNILIDKNGVLVKKVLSQNSPLKVNVVVEKENKSHNSIYDFEIDPKGLKDLIDEL